MTNSLEKIAVGGGCHWCTEAVFQALKGVEKVEQGYVASDPPFEQFSEGVIIHFDPQTIPLQILIEIHLHTHKSTSNHSFRSKYRSAVYCFTEEQKREVQHILAQLQKEFKDPLVTQVLSFQRFQASRESLHDYYRRNPEKPFCERYIAPKLQFLLKRYSNRLK